MRSNDKLDKFRVARGIFLHPNLEKDIREIAAAKQIEAKSYDEIKEIYVNAQAERPEYELFIDNAIEMYDSCMGKKNK